MKRRDLLKRLRAVANARGVEFEKVREGGEHTVYRIDAVSLTIPRHREINEITAAAILKHAAQENEEGGR